MSDRAFGLAWCGILGFFALLPLWRGQPPHLPLAVLAALLALTALCVPRLLAGLNRLWTRFGKFMHGVTSTVVLTLLYYAFLTPGAALLRLFGRNQLSLEFDREARTYWTERPQNDTDFTRPY